MKSTAAKNGKTSTKKEQWFVTMYLLTPRKINGWNIIMEVWFRSFSFLNGWFVGSMLIFQGVVACNNPNLNLTKFLRKHPHIYICQFLVKKNGRDFWMCGSGVDWKKIRSSFHGLKLDPSSRPTLPSSHLWSVWNPLTHSNGPNKTIYNEF